jgi:hypothetical protein
MPTPGSILFDNLDLTPGVGKYIDDRHRRCAEKYAKKAKQAEADYYSAAKALEEHPGGVRKKMLQMKMARAEKKYVEFRDKSNHCAQKAVLTQDRL